MINSDGVQKLLSIGECVIIAREMTVVPEACNFDRE